MNIWLIQSGEPLPINDTVRKMRTALLADKLIAKGHSVVWWTSAFDHIKKKWIYTKDTEVRHSHNLTFVALKGTGYKSNISLMRFIDHRIIAWKFSRMTARMAKPDFIIASMPPHDFAYQAVIYAKRNNIPVLVDIRDPWPDIFLEFLPLAFRKIAQLFLFNEFSMIKKIMRSADGLIAVTQNFLQWGLNYSGREKSPDDRIFPLGYQHPPSENMNEVIEKHRLLLSKLQGKFIVLFIGTISSSYHNPYILLQVAKQLSAFNNIHFLIACDGTGELYEKIVSESKKLDNISLSGWLDRDEIEFWLQKSAVGICPATKEVHLPTNKSYAYFSAGLPVISAFQGDLKALIEKYKIGFYYAPNNAEELAMHIKKLYEDKVLYQDMSKNATNVFNKFFDANVIYEEFANHIEQMAVKNNVL